MHRKGWTLMIGLLVLLWIAGSDTPAFAVGGAPILQLVETIPAGGMVDSLVVDVWANHNDVVLFDLSDSTLRFLDGATLALSPDELDLPTWGFDAWMAYDPYRGHTYVLQVKLRQGWQEAVVHVLNRRTLLAQFSVNAGFNATSAADVRYTISGFTIKPSQYEGDGPARLFVDNTYTGKVDVIDLDAAGLKPKAIQRWSYRSNVAGTPLKTILGNSLALEARHETLLSDDLVTKDILYLLDANDRDDRVRAVRINHPQQPLGAVGLPPLDFATVWPYNNGVQGLSINEARDTLWIGTALQSFDTGYLAAVHTPDNRLQEVKLQYADAGFVLVDWYDPERVFVTTFDGFKNDPANALYVHLLYGSDVHTLALRSYPPEVNPSVRAMAFDPYHRRLYIAAEGELFVVEVNAGVPNPSLPQTPPRVALLRLQSPYIGTLIAPDDAVRVDFFPNAVNQETEVLYAETMLVPASHLEPVRAFELTATRTADGAPVTTFGAPIPLTVHYADEELGGVRETTCALYWWNGTAWVREATSVLDAAANEVTATVDHMSLFAVMGETRRLYLPAIGR